MYLLFTTNTCPNCKLVKARLEERDLQYQIINASEPEGLALAREHQIAHVPTLIELDASGNTLHSFYGIDEIEELLAEIKV